MLQALARLLDGILAVCEFLASIPVWFLSNQEPTDEWDLPELERILETPPHVGPFDWRELMSDYVLKESLATAAAIEKFRSVGNMSDAVLVDQLAAPVQGSFIPFRAGGSFAVKSPSYDDTIPMYLSKGERIAVGTPPTHPLNPINFKRGQA